MKKISKLAIITTYLPAFLMVFLALLSFSNLFDDMFRKGLLINSLILYYPSFLFLQGIVTAMIKGNPFLNVGTSLISFMFILIIWLNRSALIYIIIYLITFLLGYWIIKMFKKSM